MTVYLTAQEVLAINERLIGPDKLRDFGLLDGSVMRPMTTVFGEDAFPTIFEKAAALLHGLVRNHPFLDANKRTGLTATAMFLTLNGWPLRAYLDQGELVAFVVDVAEGQHTIESIAAWLKANTAEIDFQEQ